MGLKDVPTEQLAEELFMRPDLLDRDGVMPQPLYQLVVKIQPLPCVDGVAVRKNGDYIEAMAIRRGTGHEKGKWCSVGGRIRRNESIESALRRQFRIDLGCEIEALVPWWQPTTVAQFAPAEEVKGQEGFSLEYGKHAISLYYLVRLLGESRFGTTDFAGQEALGVAWFTLGNLPRREAFGFDQRPRFEACLRAAEELLR